MHKISIYSIEKKVDDSYENIIKEYKKMIKKFAKLDTQEIFNKQIALAQKSGESRAKESYSEVYNSKLGAFNIILDEKGKELDSIEFSEIFKNRNDITFFIGGAYGLDESFKKKGDEVISLSRFTLSHKIAKVLLFEQIFRALSIVNHHPYHK